ncbi:MAG: transposase [Bacteroidota bacterium]
MAVWDEINQQNIELITNNFKWASQTIAGLYKYKWEIEVFFRDMKQLLHIKTFVGTSKNSVMIQIWTALIKILLIKAMRTTSHYK